MDTELSNKCAFVPLKEEIQEVVVAELIDLELHTWRSEFIMDMFEQVDAEAICII